MTSTAAKLRAAQLRAGAAGQGSPGVAGGLAGGDTWVWNVGTTMGTTMSSHLTQIKYVKYINDQASITKGRHNTITPPRCKIYQEWRDSTPRHPTEEPDICEWVVKIDPGPSWMEWSAHLTWERWCQYVSPDGDVDTAFARLKSLARGEYRLQQMSMPKPKSKYNQGEGNCLMFTTEPAARRVLDAFSAAIGNELLAA